MLSRILQAALALELLICVALGLWLHGRGASLPVASLGPLGGWLLWRASIPALSFVVSGVWRRREVGGVTARLRAAAWETALTVWLYMGPQAFPALFRPRPAPGKGPVVVLVHGFFCNGGVWNWLGRQLARAGYVRVHTVDLDPLYLDMQRSLADFHGQLSHILATERVEQAVLIGHSMGGVLVRLYRRQYRERVSLAVCLGAPHYGTRMSHWVRAGERGPATPKTRWLADANTAHHENAVDHGLINIWSEADNIVAPQEHARLPGVEEHRYTAHGHLRLAATAEVLPPLLAALGLLREP